MMLKELKALWEQMGNRVFTRELLGSFLTWGIIIGVLALMISLWYLKDRRAQVLALILLCLSSLSVYPIVHRRPKTAPSTVPSENKWTVQMQHRVDFQWVWWGFGGLSFASLCLLGRGKAGDITGIATAVLGTGAAIYAMWLWKEEVEVHHPETRLENQSGKVAPAKKP